MIRLLTGDVRDVLPTLASDSVHCVVTSPPYYGLRDYGTALWDGGDDACQHMAPATGSTQNKGNNGRNGQPYRDTCGKCGARRIDRQLGLESSPEGYLAAMVAVFREVRRVMRDDAVCFCNMGDGYRDKQLLLMPARLALALQADGWWVRSDIIWAKPNPMPESCRDRCTSAHEHVFMLTKKPRYYFDADAIAEPAMNTGGGEGATPDKAARAGITSNGTGLSSLRDKGAATRACRNVWTIPTHAYPAAHFATYPPELAERCIKAGTSERGCCAACGAPWQRITERSVAFISGSGKAGNVPNGKHAGSVQALSGDYDIRMGPSVATTTTGWSPSCQCNADVVPCTVLDPFCGAGTTLLVADRLQRHAIGIDLNASYADLARRRIEADAPLFTSWAPAEDPADQRMADLFAGDEYQQLSAAVPDVRRDAFRNSERYVNQGNHPSNGVPEAAE